MNDAVDWALDLGGGTRVALVQAGTFRSDAGALFGPVPRLLWASARCFRDTFGAGASSTRRVPVRQTA